MGMWVWPLATILLIAAAFARFELVSYRQRKSGGGITTTRRDA